MEDVAGVVVLHQLRELHAVQARERLEPALQQNRRKQRRPIAGDEARQNHVVPVLVHGQLHEIGHDALPDAFLEMIVAACLEDGPQE